ncbi:MAG: hypothetical protein NC189_08560, partial [Bacteroides sp.]|nr:hypothetical protein [Bacteroides sp.]
MNPKRIITFLTIAAVALTAASVNKKKRAAAKKAPKTEVAAPQPDKWALIKVAAACLRTEPSHSSQLETQASYGTPAR